MSEAYVGSSPGLEARRGFEDEAVAAERAFAIRAAYDGIPSAFLSVLAEDAMVLGDGPEPGRPAYEALPKVYPGQLQWEPALVAASADGTLACTAGPYRLLDATGHERSAGVYFSVWRRNPLTGSLELVLDFGSKGAAFPAMETGLTRLPVPECREGAESLEGHLGRCLEEGGCPVPTGTFHLGEPGGTFRPLGFHLSLDRELGALWGARVRADGSAGGFVRILGQGPVVLAGIDA